MIRRLAPWLLRAGALLGVAAFFLPQFGRPPKIAVQSPCARCFELAKTEEPELFILNLALALAPAVGCLLVLGAGWSRGSASVVFRWGLVVFFFLWAFLVATMGSILATTEPPAGAPGGDETASTLLLFATPLVLVTIVMARLLGGSGSRFPGGMVAASVGLLLLARSLHALQSPYFTQWAMGALAPILAGALIAAGALLGLEPTERAASVPAPREA